MGTHGASQISIDLMNGKADAQISRLAAPKFVIRVDFWKWAFFLLFFAAVSNLHYVILFYKTPPIESSRCEGM